MSATQKLSQQQIELEFAYTEPLASCMDPTITAAGDLRNCRRPKKHAGVHASGFGEQHEQWGQGR